MIKNKFLVSFFLSLLVFVLSNNPVSAALVNIDNKGQVIWQVLGDSTNLPIPKPSQLEVKSVADNKAAFNNQIALTNENGKITLNGMDVTNLNQSLIEVEQRGNANDLKIAASGNMFNIEEQGITAQTLFPITVDPIKNELSVKTNSGDRLLSILPYEATLSVIRANIINKVNSNQIKLAESTSGILEYSVSGIRNINLFNVAKIEVPVTSNVSASTGEILKVDEPQWLKFFGFLFS